MAARYWLTIARLGIYSTRREAYDAALRAADLYRPLAATASRLFDALLAAAVQGIRFGTTEDMARAIDEATFLVRPEWPPRQRAFLEFARSRLCARQGRMEDSLAAALRQVAISEQQRQRGQACTLRCRTSSPRITELGRPEAALARARSSIARLDVIGGSAGAGHLWLGVLNAEALLGRVDAAVAAGRTAYALLLREGDEKRVFWGLALCAALQGRLADAARITGYADAALVRAGVGLEMHWTTMGDRLEPMFRAGLAPGEIERLRDEGAAMREEDAVRLALGIG